MNKSKMHIASCSFGKDSMATILLAQTTDNGQQTTDNGPAYELGGVLGTTDNGQQTTDNGLRISRMGALSV